ncbi:acyl-CoA carboxylase subunit epsilon [Streptomyces orinoci]|uniref:Acyl-CoA carboxylase subunit epsilon n=1 Tax=Streptomyces orinoci TaxID=67339 RepID=A0ABV3K7X7_STRON|nr:acyl-CoA carboxylase subunit epsilon [Streptomyces orinoci]
MTGSGEAFDLRVVRGDATPEELAAAVVVVRTLLAREAGGEDTGQSGRPPSPRTWSAPAERLTAWPVPRGPGAWRNSGRPR